MFSHREIWNAAIADPMAGGFAAFRNENNEIWIHQNSMIKMLPDNLRRMTKTQKQMCGCEHCIDGRALFQALMEWRNGCLKNFDDNVLHQTLGSYCPGVLFPYARQIVSDLVMNGGFQPLLLQPVNFDQLYAQQMQQAQQQAESATKQ